MGVGPLLFRNGLLERLDAALFGWPQESDGATFCVPTLVGSIHAYSQELAAKVSTQAILQLPVRCGSVLTERL